MGESNIIERITAQYNALTKAEKRVADFVLANPMDAQYMSITDLAASSKVAEATIFRFCKTVGLSGYNEFKLSLAKSTVPSLPHDTVYDIYGKVKPGDSISDMCTKLYNSEVEALTQTLQKVDPDTLTRAVDILVESERVFCFGQGGSSILAMEAWGRFITAATNFYHIADNHLQAMSAALMGPKDAILFFSYSGSTRDMLEILPLVRENGVKVILITHFPDSEGTQFADTVLLCGSNEGPLQMGSIAAKVAQLFLIDILFNEYCRRDLDKTMLDREATTKAITGKML